MGVPFFGEVTGTWGAATTCPDGGADGAKAGGAGATPAPRTLRRRHRTLAAPSVKISNTRSSPLNTELLNQRGRMNTLGQELGGVVADPVSTSGGAVEVDVVEVVSL